jgi:hypothetical protein
MKKITIFLGVLLLLVVGSLVVALAVTHPQRSSKQTHPPAAHIMVAPDEVKWGPAPPALPPGAQVAVLEGDPGKAGVPFTIRAKFPDGYKVPPHWHPTDERVTVLQGALGVGVGETFNASAGRELGAGGYAEMPRTVRHFAWAVGETVVQISAIGPFEVNYVNPTDDPRKAK